MALHTVGSVKHKRFGCYLPYRGKGVTSFPALLLFHHKQPLLIQYKKLLLREDNHVKMAVAPDLTIFRVRLANNALHTVKLEYKYYLDPNWTLVGTGYALDSQGYISPAPVISGLETNKQYYIRATDEFCGITSIESFTYYQSEEPEPPLQGQWLISSFVCEQVGQFSLQSQITGLSSPSPSFLYDEETELVFFADYDDVGGFVGSYDPLTATTKADITYYQPIFSGSIPPAQRYYYANIADKQNRRIIMAGKDTDGLQAFNIPTGTVTVVPYGFNVNVAPNPVSGNGFNRTQLLLFNTTILATDAYSLSLYIFDRTNLILTNSIPFSSIIDSDKCFIGSPLILQVGNEYWVMHNLGNSTQAPNQTANIYRYNLTFSNTPSVIDISTWCTPWSNGAYSRSAIHIPETNSVYVMDFGGNSLIKINTITLVATRTHQFVVRNGKSNTSLGFVRDPITNELFLSGGFANSVSDVAPSTISYKYSLDNDLRTYAYPGTVFSSLVRIGSSDILHGGNSGNVAWVGGAWSTDGSISIFNKAGAGDDNTGIKIPTVLEFNYEPIPPGTPTGQFKSNTPGDPDYITPFEDLEDCEITYAETCPVLITQNGTGLFRYEFSLPQPVTENPDITTIRVSAMSGSIEAAFDVISLPNPNPQFFEDFINVAPGTYTINVSYFDEDDNLVALCSNLKTVIVS